MEKEIGKDTDDRSPTTNVSLRTDVSSTMQPPPLLRPNTFEFSRDVSIGWDQQAMEQLNPELQSLICKFVRNVEYDFEYPPILTTIIDPFNVLREIDKEEQKNSNQDNNTDHNDIYDKLTFESLYNLEILY